MKKCLVLGLALMVAGCSPKKDTTQSPPNIATDLGKTESYFTKLYGSPKSEKHLAEIAFLLPCHGSLIRLSQRFLVQNFQSDRLRVDVVYPEPSRQAIWVKFTLPNSWTREQLSAALGAYGSDWQVVQQNPGLSFIMREKAPALYRCSNGRIAYKTMYDNLILFSPQLYGALRNQLQQTEQQKKAVPKF